MKSKAADGTPSTTEGTPRKGAGGTDDTAPSPVKKNPYTNKRQQRTEPTESPAKDDKQHTINHYFKGPEARSAKPKQKMRTLEEMIAAKERRELELKKKIKENRERALKAEEE